MRTALNEKLLEATKLGDLKSVSQILSHFEEAMKLEIK